MKILDNFVQKYESILNMKKKYSDEEYTLSGYVVHIGVLFVVFSIFFGIGYIFGMTKNLSYVAYSINAAIFGSFLFVYITFEDDFKKQFNVVYDVKIAIIIKLAKLLVIQFSITALLFFFVFGLVVSNIEIIVLLSLVVLLLIFLVLVFDRIDFYQDSSKLSYSNIFVITVYYLIGFRMFQFFNITATVLLFTATLLVLILLRQVIKQLAILKKYHVYIRYFAYAMVLIGMSNQTNAYGGKSSYINFEEFDRESFYIGTLANIEKTKILEVPEIKYIYYEDYYYGIVDQTVFIFDKYFDFYDVKFQSPNVPFSKDSVLYIENNNVLLESIVENVNQYERHTYLITMDAVTLVSTEESNQELSYVNQFPNEDYNKLPDLTIGEVIDGNVYINSYVGTLKYTMDLKYLEIVDDVTVTYEDSLFVSNGYTLTQNSKGSFIIESNTNSQDVFKGFLPEENKIWQYYYYNNMHYINSYGGILYKYNNDGELEEFIYSNYYFSERILFVEDTGYLFFFEASRNSLEEGFTIYQYNLDDISDYVFKQRTNLYIPDASIFHLGDVRMHANSDIFFEFTFILFLILVPPSKRKQ